MTANGSKPRADLVLAGGGVKGIGHVGALSVLEEHDYEIRRIAGTSAGAIVGAFAASGMSADEVHKVMSSVDFRQFRDCGTLGKIPGGSLLSAGLSLLSHNGAYEGDAAREWIKGELEKKGIRTFADLKIKDAGSSLPPEQSYKLVVHATDVTRGELVRLPWDYERYGLDPDKQLVCDAVRASISIPFFFRPVSLPYKGVPSMLVDGGVLSNFPIDAFDRTDGEPPRWPTFGVTLIPELPAGNKDLFPVLGVLKQGPVKLAERLVTTMLVGHDQTHLAKPWIAARAMKVMTNDVGVVDFGISPAQQMELFENGRTAARSFLRTWDWDAYRERFRLPATAAVPAAA
jgi:NTE family protein